jgi:hypothetical protein
VSAAAWLSIALTIAELCGREVVRASLLQRVIGIRPGLFALTAAAVAAGAILIVVTRRNPPSASASRVAVVFAVLFTLGVAFQLQLGARLQSDGFYYFAYLRSMAFDRDVNFANDYRLLGLGDKAHLFQLTPTGYAQSAWTVGPAIVWAPFFAAGHAVARQLSASNPNVSTNGVSFPYRQAVCIAGLFYALLGCWFCFRAAAIFYPRPLAAAATALVVGGSFMIWYIVKEPSMTHAPSMAAVAGFVWAWLATRGERTIRQWALLGAIAGFMALIRWQNALFALLPACDAIGALVAAARASDRPRMTRTLIGGAIFTGCAVVAFLPQMIAWHSIYGTWLAVSPVGPQIRWSDPHLADILWSSRNGLFSWSPILYCAAIGLVVFAAARPAIGVPALLAVGVMTYFNACIQDWWGSAGFGGRRFDGLIPLFSIGAAAFGSSAAAMTRRHPLPVVAGAGSLLVLWNLALMSAAQDGIVRIGESLSFGDAAAAQSRALHRWFGNPFTYPASLAFAVRNGVGPADYDLLSANRFLIDPLRPYGRVDIGAGDAWLLQEGWHSPEREGAATYRWAASPAVILIPLDHAAALTVQIRLHAFKYPGWPGQMLTLMINGRAYGPVAVPESWQTLEFATTEDAWHAGVNRLQFDFASVRTPAEVGLGGDSRPLSAAVDYLRVEER